MITKRYETNKLGRNTLCFCGSGKKYKKCCLERDFGHGSEENKRHALISKVKERYPDNGITIAQAEEFGMIKMSEVILEYAEELLSDATTKESKERIIMLAVVAWNLALIDEGDCATLRDKFLRTLQIEENSNDWHEMDAILKALIYKKQLEYPMVDRHI